jgi:hypothetical protein
MLPEGHYGRRRGRNVSRETFRPSKTLPYFLSHKKIPMGCSLNHPIPLQKRLSVQKLFPAGFHRKAREFPGDDPGKPDQRACIPEADRLKGFLCFQNAKAKELQLFPGNIQILLRKGKRRCRIQKKLHQIPVVLRAYLLRHENAAGFQNPKYLRRKIIPVAVENQIKTLVREGKRTSSIRSPEVNPQGQKNLPAESNVRRITLRGGSQGMRMPQRQEKLSAAGVHIQNTMRGAKKVMNCLTVVPGETLTLFIAVLNVGEIPPVDISGLLF